MRNSNCVRRLLLVGAIMALATSAFAGVDLTIPSWRGLDGTTYQEWLFNSNADPAAPDVDQNPYGDPVADIAINTEMGAGWQPLMEGLGTQTGLWDLGGLGTITIDLPNRPYNGGLKEIWISVTYFEDGGFMGAPTVSVASQGQVELLSESTSLVELDPISGQWTNYLSKWRIVPNPYNERILITAYEFDSVIDRIAIDTQCVPEPASIAAMLMGAPFLIMLRRRRA